MAPRQKRSDDPELDGLKREASQEEQGEREQEHKAGEEYLESTERSLRRIFENLGYLPEPLYCDSDEQRQLAHIWAPLAKDWEAAPDADAPAWMKWAVAVVGTGVIAAPKLLAAYYLAQMYKAGEGSSEGSGQASTADDAAEEAPDPGPAPDEEGAGAEA